MTDSLLDRLSRSDAFIATLMDSKGSDLAIADMPGANRLTAAEHEPPGSCDVLGRTPGGEDHGRASLDKSALLTSIVLHSLGAAGRR
jgi:hypothetical protein